jgi:hypothetical protein
MFKFTANLYNAHDWVTLNWDGRDYIGNLVNAGVYIYQIEADAFIQTKRMVLLK